MPSVLVSVTASMKSAANDPSARERRKSAQVVAV
jgi:hypothetical protein